MAELRVKSTGTLKLFESDNTSSVTIASPASLGADRTVTLPDGDVTLVAGTMSAGFAVADITGQTALGAKPADTDEFVLSDAGVLKRVDYSYIKAANTPAFQVNLGASQDISNNTYTLVAYDTVVWDTASCYDATTNYRYTPDEAGKYIFYAQVSPYAGLPDNVKFQTILFKKNGSDASYFARDSRNSYSLGYGNVIMTYQTLDMNGSSDYVDVFFYIQVSDDTTLRMSAGHQSTYFGGYKLIGV